MKPCRIHTLTEVGSLKPGGRKPFRQSFSVVIVLVMALAMSAAGGLVGCRPSSEGGDSQQGATAPEGAGPRNLIITNEGYTIQKEGYAIYCIVVHNPNTDVAAKSYTLSVTGKDADDGNLFSIEQAMPTILPGETQYFGSSIDYGSVVPDSLDLTVSAAESDWLKTEQKFVESYAVTNTSETLIKPYVMSYGGEIVALDEASTGAVWITVVLFTEDEKIIYCGSTLVNDVTLDQATPFEIIVKNPANHTHYRMFALNWSQVLETPMDIRPE